MPDPAALAQWFQIIFFLAGGIASIVGIAVGVAKLRQKPPAPTELRQPVIVQGAEVYVPRPEYERDRSEVRAELARHSASRKAIYDKLDEQRAMLTENATKTELTFVQVQNLDGKMDRVLERLPRKS